MTAADLCAAALDAINRARAAFGAPPLEVLLDTRPEVMTANDATVQALWPCGVRGNWIGGVDVLHEHAEQLAAAWGVDAALEKSRNDRGWVLLKLPPALEGYLRAQDATAQERERAI
ncbi:MAG: hypothetical protein WC273_00425 [Dehalococcoidia bacterium]